MILKVTRGDVLNNRWIVQKKNRILANGRRIEKLAAEVAQKLGKLIADNGDYLIAVKEALDRATPPDKTAWQRWLKDHIQYSQVTARRYMRLARLRKKTFNVERFFVLDISCLYSVISLPDHMIEKLMPDSPLKDPRTGQVKPLVQMSAREAIRALRYLENGERDIRTTKSIKERLGAITSELRSIEADPDLPRAEWDAFQSDIFTQSKTRRSSDRKLKTLAEFQGKTWEEAALFLLNLMDNLANWIKMLKAQGKLKGTLKKALLDKHEIIRIALLKLPAWARRSK